MKKFEQVTSHATDVLRQLQTRCTQLQQLQQYVQQMLPPLLQPHCRLLNVRNNLLIMQADSSVWATRLRFMSEDILRQVRTDARFQQCLQLEIKVYPPHHEPDQIPPTPTSPKWTPQTRKLFQSAAETLPYHPLQAAFLRMLN